MIFEGPDADEIMRHPEVLLLVGVLQENVEFVSAVVEIDWKVNWHWVIGVSGHADVVADGALKCRRQADDAIAQVCVGHSRVPFLITP